MGGVNENILKPDVAKSSILKPDLVEPSLLHRNTQTQTQEVRMHMNAGQVHLHVDAEKLKVAIPVAEWYNIIRNIKSFKPHSFIDVDNKTVALFKSHSNKNNKFEINILIEKIEIGDRFSSMLNVTG